MEYNYKRILSSIAQQDVDSTVAYIVKQLCNPKAAFDLLAKIQNTVDSICAFPRSFHDCKAFLIDNEEIRCAIIDNYALIYEIVDSKKTINILRFVYAKMDLSNLSIK